MKLLIDILQGLGLSGAAGIRPFLPAFVAGAVGRANLFADFERTDFAFVESNAWLIATAVVGDRGAVAQRTHAAGTV